MRTLTAVESSALARLMVVEIALLAWLVLGESLSALEVGGLGLTLAGVLIVQSSASRDVARVMPAG